MSDMRTSSIQAEINELQTKNKVLKSKLNSLEIHAVDGQTWYVDVNTSAYIWVKSKLLGDVHTFTRTVDTLCRLSSGRTHYHVVPHMNTITRKNKNQGDSVGDRAWAHTRRTMKQYMNSYHYYGQDQGVPIGIPHYI